MNIIATNIVKRRKELKMTQKELAEKLHISDKTISRWETGNQIPDALTIPEIAKVLEMTIDELYGMESTEKRAKDPEDASESKEEETLEESEYPNLKYGALFLFKAALLIGLFVCLAVTTTIAINPILALSIWSVIYGFLFLGIGIFFFICEFAFYEFYKRKDLSFYYEQENVKWFGMALIGLDLILTVWMPFAQSSNMYTYHPYLIIMITVVFNLILFLLSCLYQRRLIKQQYEISKAAFVIPLLLMGIAITFAIWYGKTAETPLITYAGFSGINSIRLKKLRFFAALSGGIMTVGQIISYILIRRVWAKKATNKKAIQRTVTVLAAVLLLCTLNAVISYRQLTLYDVLTAEAKDSNKQYTVSSMSVGIDFGTGNEQYNYFTLTEAENMDKMLEQLKNINVEKGQPANTSDKGRSCVIQFEGNSYDYFDSSIFEYSTIDETLSWRVDFHESGEIWYRSECYRMKNSVDWNTLFRIGLSEYDGANQEFFEGLLK